jgi:uncharacterized protein (DUF1778 family)
MSETPHAFVLSVRVNRGEWALLQAASEQARTSLNEFVRRNALVAAEAELLKRRVVTIPAEDWEALEAWVHRPPAVVPGLKRLARLKPCWER